MDNITSKTIKLHLVIALVILFGIGCITDPDPDIVQVRGEVHQLTISPRNPNPESVREQIALCRTRAYLNAMDCDLTFRDSPKKAEACKVQAIQWKKDCIKNSKRRK